MSTATLPFMTASAPAPLPAGPAAAGCSPPLGLVDWVVYKWLMAREGERVDAMRAMDDGAYAHECLSRGLHAGHGDLRETARQMMDRLAPPARRC
jgi:hypothetical protein